MFRAAFLFGVALGGCLLASTVVAETSGSIRLHGRAQVTGERILLEELGSLSGEAAEFADVDLGYAPEAGAVRRVTGAAILARLREAGMDDARIRYSIPASVRVERAHQEIDPEELREAIQRELAEWLPPGDSIDTIELPPRVRVPLGDYAVRVGAPEAITRQEHEVGLEIEQEGRVVARPAARLRIASRGPVVVARRAVPRGATLGADDVRVEERSLRGLPPSILSGADEAVGRLARVTLAPGTVLTARSVEIPALVESGSGC